MINPFLADSHAVMHCSSCGWMFSDIGLITILSCNVVFHMLLLVITGQLVGWDVQFYFLKCLFRCETYLNICFISAFNWYIEKLGYLYVPVYLIISKLKINNL